MRATLSVLGLYNEDATLFDDMVVPQSDHLSKEDLIENILAQCAELEVLYTDPVMFKHILKYWSRSRLHVWQELADTMDYDYNPIWNKDVHDVEYIKNTKDESSVYSDQASNTSSGTTTNQAVAFNSGTFDDREKDTSSGSMSSTDNSTTRDSGYHDESRDLVSQGNQGVTSTQQLIKEQREISEFSLYDIIIKEFKLRFCLLVY